MYAFGGQMLRASITVSTLLLLTTVAAANPLPDIARADSAAHLPDSAFADGAALNPDHAKQPTHAVDHEYDAYLFRPTSERSDTPVVVYFHGWDAKYQPSHVRTQLERYWAAGYIVVWLGAGESRWPSSSDKALAALQAALAAVAPPSGSARSVVFVAHSAGTLTAVETAAKAIAAGVALSGLVLHDPADGGSGAFMPPPDASALPASLPMVMLVAATSSDDANATRVRNALYTTARTTTRAMWLVPHACVSEASGGFDYQCPGYDDKNVALDDLVTPTSRQYVSTHNQTIDITMVCPNNATLCLPSQLVEHVRTPSPRTHAAIFDHTLGCIDEMARHQPGPGCFGDAASYAGTWSNGVDASQQAAPLERMDPK
jgi:acetyl esterase/lipase